jgi:DNA-binding response OmpR family regulator
MVVSLRRVTSNPRILVAEDDADIRFILATLLLSHGYEVDEAEDGAVALEKLSAAKFDLMVLDLTMPRVDGFEVLKRMSIEQRSEVPVLVLTASARNQARFPHLVNENTRCMTKPCHHADVLSTIRQLLVGKTNHARTDP